MKKVVSMMLLALMVCAAALAESAAPEIAALEGVVLEIQEDSGYLIADADGRKVQALTNEETVWEVDREIAVGDYLYIDYDGKMTRSVPAQITAQVVRMHVLEGFVTEADLEANAILLTTPDQGEAYVTLPESMRGEDATGKELTVYFNGVMTMSLPPQVNAGYVVYEYAVQGEVTEICDEYIVVGEGQEAVQVNVDAAQRPETLKVGDVIRVRYDGAMTRSLPPQISADEIIQISR